jgi:hypothetical protein
VQGVGSATGCMATCSVEAQDRLDGGAAECRRGARTASVPAARAPAARGPKKWGIQISEPASTRPAEVWPAREQVARAGQRQRHVARRSARAKIRPAMGCVPCSRRRLRAACAQFL